MSFGSRGNGANFRNSVDVIANSVHLYNEDDSYTDVLDIFVHKTHIASGSYDENNKFDYQAEQVDDTYVSGLDSMIKYIKNQNKRPKKIFVFEDETFYNIDKHLHFHKTVSTNMFNQTDTFNNIKTTITKVQNYNSYPQRNDTFTMNKTVQQNINNYNIFSQNNDTYSFNKQYVNRINKYNSVLSQDVYNIYNKSSDKLNNLISQINSLTQRITALESQNIILLP
jgi:hypothetical protein